MNKKNEATLIIEIDYDPNNLESCNATVKAKGTDLDLLGCLGVAVTKLCQAGLAVDDLFKAFLLGLELANKED